MVKLVGPLLQARACRIKLVVSDVDGVLTDAGVYYSAEGEALKRFSMRDGLGVELLREAGIATALFTREQSQIVAARAKKLGIELVWSGHRDKRMVLPSLLRELGVEPEEVAYIGDDLNDLEALRWLADSGLSACPADAALEVAEAVHFVTAARGGHGAYRELCDVILESQRSKHCDGNDSRSWSSRGSRAVPRT